MREQHCTLMFVVDDDSILLAFKKKGFGQGKWNGPGGKVEPNENEVEAAIRETEEEVGVMPIDPEKVAHLKFSYEGKDMKPLYKDKDGPSLVIVHAYLAKKWEGIPAETEEMRPQWFKFSEVPYRQMWDDDQYWLPKVLGGKKLVARFKFDKDDKVASKNIGEVDKL